MADTAVFGRLAHRPRRLVPARAKGRPERSCDAGHCPVEGRARARHGHRRRSRPGQVLRDPARRAMIENSARGIGDRHALLALMILLGALLMPAWSASSHEASMSVMSLRELAPGRYISQWTMPPTDESLQPIFPPHCRWNPPELDC